MPKIRVVFLWHMHQPFYKDLVTGEYRLPWVRMHALKDYYGMVKLLDEFPLAHQTFNLVPSLMAQIEDYARGTAHDPFLNLVAKPAAELSPEERRFTLQYLFQANVERMIRRYPRYAELWEQANSPEKAASAERHFSAQDFTDLQVLSQLAWFDEFFLPEPEIAELVRKGRDYSAEEQQRLAALERERIARVLPAYAQAAERGGIEISVSPFYHPILPLLCDTNLGRVSAPGIALPERFRHPEDARQQLQRGIELQEKTFGVRPRGVWPSEGSVSDEVLTIAAELGLDWIATDEGVLGRSLGIFFERNGAGRLDAGGAERLYRIYHYEKGKSQMRMIFRDHSLSDLIGFVYSGMDARQAAAHFTNAIRESAAPLLAQGRDATVPVILDGENCWEHYHESGREFLRRLYDAMEEADIEQVTVSEAIARERDFGTLTGLTPGSWINANFNVWIGAPEDNKSWNYLKAARDFYDEHDAQADEDQRKLAFEELLIAEGSDWNWWYGPEHHSANDRDFDQLYRQHLSNVYRALGASPPAYLAHSIIEAPQAGAHIVPQTSYIHPRITGSPTGYFDWIGAAMLLADTRDSAMHGHEVVLAALYGGVDEQNLYLRLDLAKLGVGALDLAINLESIAAGPGAVAARFKLEIELEEAALQHWRLLAESANNGESTTLDAAGIEMRLGRVLELSIPLARLQAIPGCTLRVRTSAWRAGLPIDSLPGEGWLELFIASEEKLQELAALF